MTAEPVIVSDPEVMNGLPCFAEREFHSKTSSTTLKVAAPYLESQT